MPRIGPFQKAKCPECGGKAKKWLYKVKHKTKGWVTDIRYYCVVCAAEKNARRAKYRQAWHRARKYGITVEQLTALIEAQEGLCAVCGKPLEEAATHVDHDHKTKKVRGALCFHCNTGLGQFGDNIELLLKAVAYLQRHANSTSPSSVA